MSSRCTCSFKALPCVLSFLWMSVNALSDCDECFQAGDGMLAVDTRASGCLRPCSRMQPAGSAFGVVQT